MERAEEIAYLCEQNGWIFTVGLEPDQPEDISDLLKMLKDKRPASSPGSRPVTVAMTTAPAAARRNTRTAAGIGTIRKGLSRNLNMLSKSRLNRTGQNI